MEVSIIEETKDKLVFEVRGETNTISNVLKKELWNDSDIKISGYYLEHPLVHTPKFVVQTNGSDPRKAVKSAIKRIEKEAEKLLEEAKNIK